MIPFCVILSDASKHVFLFNYELLYLKDILWRPKMPKCIGIECVVKPESASCRYNHMFAGVSVCFDNATALGTIGFSDFYTNAHVTVNGTRFKQMFNKLMYMYKQSCFITLVLSFQLSARPKSIRKCK